MPAPSTLKRHVSRVLVACCVLVSGVLLPTACQSTPAKPAAVHLAAGVEQYREDEVTGRLQVQLTEKSSQPATVTYVRVLWNGFSRSPEGAQNYPLMPGVEVALPVDLDMPAVCDRTPETHAQVDVTLAHTAEPQRVTITDPYGVLMRVWHRMCERQAVQRAVGLSFGPTFTPEGHGTSQRILAQLVIDRREWTGPITITDLRGTVLLTLDLATGTLPLALPATDSRATVPIVLHAARCDLHALGEAKKPFSFVVGIRFGTGPRLPGDLLPNAAGKAILWRVIKAGCGVP